MRTRPNQFHNYIVEMLPMWKCCQCENVANANVANWDWGIGNWIFHRQENNYAITKKIRHLCRNAKDISYHVDSRNRECDFVVEHDDGSFSVVQACYELTDDNREREFDGLASAVKRFGLKSGVIVTCRQSDEAIHDGCEISIVPAYDYLSK